MYNLIPDFKTKTFTLYHDLKIEAENISPQQIPHIKHNLNIRYLQAFKNLFNFWFLYEGFKPLHLGEDFKEKTYKCVASETETFFFEFCVDNENTTFYIKNIETQFQKLPNTATLEYILELEKTAESLGFTGITAGGAVRHYWKNKFNGWYITNYKLNTKNISEEDYKIIENSLRGGLCVLNDKYKNKMLNNTFTIDINSLYPYIALYYCLPYDNPVNIDYLDAEQLKTAEKTHFKYKTCIYKVDITKCKIKPNKIKWLAFKDKNKTIYPDRIRNIVYLWDFELERLKIDYDLKEYQILNALCFKVRRGTFDDIFENLKAMKESAEKNSASYKLSKQYLNSFLGKFATKKTRTYDTFKLSSEDKTGEINDIELSTTEAQTDDNYYLPLFSYITARGRVFMAEYINDVIGYENFIYCDTDSITAFNCGGLKAIEKDASKFGYFRIESENVKAVFKKPKFYCKETKEGEIKGVCAGINNEYFNLNVEEFKAGKAIYIKKIICPEHARDFPEEKYFKIYI